MIADGCEFKNMDDVGDFNEIKDQLVNANVYYGREPLMDCLSQGADVVLTGRAADSAMFLAPLAYEFGWTDQDLDDLARGIMAGHLLECGGQGLAATSSTTGGMSPIWTSWASPSLS